MAKRIVGSSLAIAWLIGCVSACSCESKTGPQAVPSASADVSASAMSSAPEPPRRHGEDVQPVYPFEDAGAPDPAVAKLCATLHTNVAHRHAECCPSGSPVVDRVSDCQRMLGYAVRHHAVTLDAAAVDACAAAMDRALQGCDWVTPGAPPVPPECEGLVKGALKTGDSCRSSLECPSGERCHGLGAIDPGKCGLPHDAGYRCNLGTESLVSATSQYSSEADHLECKGVCRGRLCFDATPVGAACENAPDCGKNHCVNGKCAAGALPKVDQPCATGECERGLKCVSGTCRAPKHEGEDCSADGECRGSCVRGDAGATGKCEKTCSIALPSLQPAKPPASSTVKPGVMPPGARPH